MFFKIDCKGPEGNTGSVILYNQIFILPLLLLLFIVGSKT